MEVNGVQWLLDSVVIVDVNGRRVTPWTDEPPASNARSSTALPPPVLNGIGRFPVTNNIEAQPPEPLDIMRALDDLEAYRDAERHRQQALRDETVLGIAQLINAGRMDDARAVAAGTRDLLWGDVYEVQFAPAETQAQYVVRLQADRELEEAAAVFAAVELLPDEAARAAHDADALAALMAHAMKRLKGLANPATIERAILDRVARGVRPAA